MKKALSLLLVVTILFCFFACDDSSYKDKAIDLSLLIIPVEGITLNRTSITDLPISSTTNLVATITPTSATNKTVKWTSSNTNIATVDKTGKVTGINSGTTYIIATTADGGFSKSCFVKVLDRFTVTFDPKGGSSVASQTVDDGYKATIPTNPTKPEYGCAGWTTDSNAFTTSADFDFNTPITTDTKLYAKWDKNVFNIIYKDKNNENFSGNHASIYPVKHYYGTPTALDSPTRTGYTFNGWSTETNCTTTITSLGATDYNSDITLYALWLGNTYTVTFDVNTGDSTSPTSKTVTYGSAYGTLATATKTNYKLDGWYDEASGGNKITSATTVTKANNHNLYAHWIEKDKYNVVFTSNTATSGDVPTSITNQHVDTCFTVPDNTGNLAKTGYTFSGWNTEADGSGEDYTTGTNVTPTDSGTITLYAQWTANVYNITYKDQGDNAFTGTSWESTSPTSHTYGSTTILVNPSKTGYTFGGWSTQTDCATTITSLGATDYTADITLYAKWTMLITTFNINGKYAGISPYVKDTENNTVTTNTTFTLPILIYNSSTDLTKGFAVTTWTDGETEYSAGSNYTPSSDKTLSVKEGHSWVQLWENGPKWAEFNIGSTITSYSSATGSSNNEKYSTANVGGLYTWGGIQDARTSYTDDHYTGTDDLSGNSDTVTMLWGSNWKMPLYENLYAFTKDANTDHLTFTWCNGNTEKYTTDCKLNGWKISGTGAYADNSIFLPVAGEYNNEKGEGDKLRLVTTNGRYWTNKYHYRYCFDSSFNSTSVGSLDVKLAYSVRAILAE